MESSEFLTPKKYAAYIGCDVVIIDRAIKSGKIPDSCITINPVNKYKSINVAMADAAWGKNYRENRRGTNRSILRKMEEKSPESKIITAPAAPSVSRQEGEVPLSEMPELGAKTSYNEADRQKKIYEAQLLKVKLEEETGSLVKLETIKRAFFDQAHVVRDGFMSLADRVIDQIYTAESRNHAHIILQKEINQVLELLSKMPDSRHA